VLYDISVNALNVTSEATDLGVSITGNANSVDIGDTVHLIISLSNLGPKQCDAKLNYKIPVGLKLLSSQGPGAYDSVSGVWDAGLLLVDDTVCLDLVLQAVNIGYFVNMVSVYGDLTSTHAVPAKPIVKVFNGKWRSTAAMSDSNGGNNVASYILDVRNHFGVGYQNFDYKWPDNAPPVPEPKPEPKPDPEPQPTPNPPEPPKPNPQPNSRLGQDILNVRESVSTGTKVDSDESSSDDNQDDSKIIWDIFKEVFGSPDFDILAAMALITYMLAFLLSAVPGLVLGWTLTGILAASILVYSAILFIITILILIGALYLFYSRPKS